MSDLSQPFLDMAERIRINEGQGFGGAFVIMPPSEDAKPRVMLMLDNADSPAMFWASLQTTCTIALQEIQDEESKQGGLMGRMR